MYKRNFAFSCCGFFFLITLSRSLQNYIINEDNYNFTVRYGIDTDSTTIYDNKIKSLQYELYEELSNNMPYKMQNEFRIISKKNDREEDTISNKLNRRSVNYPEDDDEIPIKSYINSTNINHNDNFTSQKIYETLIERNNSTSHEVIENSSENSNETKIVPYEMCHNVTCILLCCPLGNHMNNANGECISEKNEYGFPNVSEYTNNSMQGENKKVDQSYRFTVHDSCRDKIRLVVDKDYHYDYTIFANGSIYLSYYKLLFKSTSYCLGVILERGNKYEVTFCSEIIEQVMQNEMYTPAGRSRIRTFKIFACLHIVCILILIPVFLVYSILPELRNIYGYMLCHYTAASCIGLTVSIAKTMHYREMKVSHSVCITVAFLEYFFIMSSLFWLSAMSFHIWRTFRGFSLLQKNVRLSQKRKLIYYTIFAYGCPFILGIVCVVIVDLISEYIPVVIRPDFEMGNCWYFATKPYLLYFYGLKSFCIISSVCLSIFAALKIKRYEKIADFRQTDSENMLYNDNKKWFNLYKNLFILMFVMMGINWSVMTLSWIFGTIMQYYIPYIITFFDIMQSLFIFIIFVWKREIKLMLLKRFGRKITETSNN